MWHKLRNGDKLCLLNRFDGGPYNRMPKDKADNYLMTINIAIVAGYLFVFTMAPKTEEVLKWLLLSAFLLYVFSLVLFMWFFLRYPKRAKLFEELLEKTRKKFANRIAKFVEDIVEPYARLRGR